MLQAHHRTFSGTIRALDLGLLGVAVAFGGAWLEPAVPTKLILLQIGYVAAAWWIVSARLDLYQSRRTENFGRELQAVAEATVLSLGVGVLIALVVHNALCLQPLWTFGLAFALLTIERASVRALLRGLRVRGYNYRFAVVVGRGRSADVLAETVQRNRHYGIRLLGSLGLSGERGRAPSGVRDLGEIGDLKQVLSEFAVDVVLLCPSHDARSGELLEVFNLCDVAGIHCHYAPSFFSLRGLHPAVVWYGNLPSFAFHTGPSAPIRLAVKRVMDVVATSFGLVILSPVMAACALAVKLHDGGSVFFRQVRVGQNGRPFYCLKFRSMCVNAEEKQKELVQANEEDGPAFKIKDDPRITPAGRFLRKYSLDELPQLFNVLRGDMSLVGPRPPIPSEVDQYDWWQRRRLSVRPGITCIWQVFGRNQVPFERWMEMDLQYIDNWSLSMDVKLLARTVGTVFKGTGV